MRTTQAVATPQDDPRRKLDTAVIASRPARRQRAELFQGYVLGSAVAFVILAIAAHSIPYFPLDLRVTHFVQQYHGAWFAQLMFGLSWLGFMPQSDVLAVAAVLAMYVTGLRWESLMLVLASCGIGVGALVKLIVLRPRPGADLVHVIQLLKSPSFPSGHVVETTTFAGFLAFLVFTLIKPSTGRLAALVVLGLVIGLMGLSRIYQGQHWFSDVMGAYLLGSLWLALTIRVYRWGKPKFFATQPVAKPGAEA